MARGLRVLGLGLDPRHPSESRARPAQPGGGALSGESGSPLNSFESKRSRQLFDDPAAETRTGFSGRLFSTALRFFPRSRGVVPSNKPQQLVAGRRSTPAESCFSSSVRVRTFRSSRAVVLVVSCNSAGSGLFSTVFVGSGLVMAEGPGLPFEISNFKYFLRTAGPFRS